MTFYNKIKWVLGILVVFLLILATNLIDRNSFLRVRNSVVSIYEDRLVAKGLLFDMSSLVHEKEVAVAASDSVFFLKRNARINTDMEELALRLETTKLTTEEKGVLKELKNSLTTLETIETAFIQSDFVQSAALMNQLAAVKKKLRTLSKIQLQEGKRQVAISQQAVDLVELFTHLEIYMLIAMAILIQVIVIYRPKEE